MSANQSFANDRQSQSNRDSYRRENHQSQGHPIRYDPYARPANVNSPLNRSTYAPAYNAALERLQARYGTKRQADYKETKF
ncbi:hypothetical protein DFA_01308 [Cavenderia fasciculata]|uniref:Uncharacterized protein n=1 Tax=Cavenderia fasciculata TaxID=261658 RepID=F4PS41_CACFS|nr:uncharacterized protein DFA_01308 [Cavenderia fasciculata]EGG21424.1 hypothetical protein DFA_01308 [Cavenderia fasciculata]|eukprot:XP_004359274.1 hypothetical protein DFA_01308 [Cavenderia fasciculata]